MAWGKISFRLSEELEEKLNALAENQGVTPSALARIFIEQGVNDLTEMGLVADHLSALRSELDLLKTLTAGALAATTLLNVPRPKGMTDISPEELIERCEDALALGAQHVARLEQHTDLKGKR